VHLADGRLPALERWPAQFAASVTGSYVLAGSRSRSPGGSAPTTAGWCDSGAPRPEVRLAPLGPDDKVQTDGDTGTRAAVTTAERSAYGQLRAGTAATVVGPLDRAADGYVLDVRLVERPA
jgi:hypothetical protein